MKRLALYAATAFAAALIYPAAGVPSAKAGDEIDGGRKPFFKDKRPRGDNPKRPGGESTDKRKTMLKALIEQEYPNKVEELEKLRKENPKKFKEEVKKLLKQIKEKKSKERKDFADLVKRYRENPSGELKSQIIERLSAQFDQRLAMMRKMVEKRAELLEKMKERLDKRLANKEKIVEERFKEITKDPALRW